jgi:F-type H+-transporting ATPase subunit epsilon
MSDFTLYIVDATQELKQENVIDFIGEDSSGSFGIQAKHARFMTILSFGLARFRLADSSWQYLAIPGGVLYFNDNQLAISTRHFFIDSNLDRISMLLDQQLAQEEESLQATRQSLHRMDQAMLKRLLALQRKSGWSL